MFAQIEVSIRFENIVRALCGAQTIDCSVKFLVRSMLQMYPFRCRRYGFMRDRCQPERCRTKTSAPYTDNNYLQYVHCTGGMFVMIPDNRTTSPLPRQRTLNSHSEYITRQRSWTSKSRSNGGASASNSAEQKEHRSYYEVCVCVA